MNVEITTRNFDLPDDMKERAESRMEKLLRFDERVAGARIVVSQEKNRFHAEALVSAGGFRMVSHAVEDSEGVALNAVLDRLEAQVKRHRDRTVKRAKKATALDGAAPPPGPAPEAETPYEQEDYEPFGDDSDYEGLVSEDPGVFSLSMSVGEAVATLKASQREVLGFTNPVTDRPMLVFKRRDGNVGIVDIEDEG